MEELRPHVSIVVPTHDRPGMLARCLDALSRLGFAGRFEVVVVDDGGRRPAKPVTADFADVCAVVGLRRPRGGPAAARNTGLRSARGELVAFTDDDCAPRPSWLAALVAAHDGPGALVGGRGANVLDRSVLAETSERLAEVAEAATGFHTTNNLLADRRRLVDLGGFDERFTNPAGEDRVLAMRWVAAGGHLVRAPRAVVDHAHAQDLASFLGQHQRFGRAAVSVADTARSLGTGPSTMTARERVRTVVAPWRRGEPGVGAATVASQAAIGVGVWRERLGRGARRLTEPGGPAEPGGAAEPGVPRFLALADLSQRAREVAGVERVVLARRLGIGDRFVDAFPSAPGAACRAGVTTATRRPVSTSSSPEAMSTRLGLNPQKLKRCSTLIGKLTRPRFLVGFITEK